jgi:hypothetical protein
MFAMQPSIFLKFIFKICSILWNLNNSLFSVLKDCPVPIFYNPAIQGK